MVHHWVHHKIGSNKKGPILSKDFIIFLTSQLPIHSQAAGSSWFRRPAIFQPDTTDDESDRHSRCTIVTNWQTGRHWCQRITWNWHYVKHCQGPRAFFVIAFPLHFVHESKKQKRWKFQNRGCTKRAAPAAKKEKILRTQPPSPSWGVWQIGKESQVSRNSSSSIATGSKRQIWLYTYIVWYKNYLELYRKYKQDEYLLYQS